MHSHPDYAHSPLLRSATLRGFLLTPLTPNEVDEDFAAVTGSAAVLAGLFGDWPAGLTLTDNLHDLAWHDREFVQNRSFAWIVRSEAGLYLGCAYLFPQMGGRGAADAYLWIIDCPDRVALLDQAQEALNTWFAERLTAEIAITWHRPV